MDRSPPWNYLSPEPLRELITAEWGRQLLVCNQARVEIASEKAKADGMDDPVIPVIDVQEDRAGRLAQLTGLPWRHVAQRREENGRNQSVARRNAGHLAPGRSGYGRPYNAQQSPGHPQPNRPGTFPVLALASVGLLLSSDSELDS